MGELEELAGGRLLGSTDGDTGDDCLLYLTVYGILCSVYKVA